MFVYTTFSSACQRVKLPNSGQSQGILPHHGFSSVALLGMCHFLVLGTRVKLITSPLKSATKLMMVSKTKKSRPFENHTLHADHLIFLRRRKWLHGPNESITFPRGFVTLYTYHMINLTWRDVTKISQKY